VVDFKEARAETARKVVPNYSLVRKTTRSRVGKKRKQGSNDEQWGSSEGGIGGKGVRRKGQDLLTIDAVLIKERDKGISTP